MNQQTQKEFEAWLATEEGQRCFGIVLTREPLRLAFVAGRARKDDIITESFKHHEPDARGIFTCTPGHPMPKGAPGRWQHEGAYESLDCGETRWMTCRDCGIKWKEELPQ